MEEVSQEVAVKGNRWRRWFAHLALCVFLFAFLGWIVLGYGGMLEAPLRLAIGWVFHGWAMLPPLLPRWTGLLVPLACLAVALGFLHRFIRWWLAAKDAATAWRVRQTLAASSLLLLGAAAAIAMSGIVHQTAWLGGERWFVNRGESPVHGLKLQRQAYEIVKQLKIREIRKGSYPESLAELNLPPGMLSVAPSRGGVPEPFTYLKPAAAPVAGLRVPVLIGPVMPPREGVMVGYLSGEIGTIPVEELSKLLDAVGSQAPAQHD